MGQHRGRRGISVACLACTALLCATPAAAQTPAEVTGVVFETTSRMAWDPTTGAGEYVIYAGPLARIRTGVLLHCSGDKVSGTSYQAEETVTPGEGSFYLITAKGEGGEGTPGVDSAGLQRFLGATCDSVLRHHVLDRLGFGWDEWTRDRVVTLGIQGYIDEQLDPTSIDESTNTELAARRLDLEPPETYIELQGLDLVNAVYARRQLEQQVTLFWSNHFNTDYRESYRRFFRYNADLPRRRMEATKLLYDELETFRTRAFGGNFREILEDSALSPAMILFLDTDNNVVGVPNENFARELLELHTMSVDGSYTHHDIDALARVMTGWNVCKKPFADTGDYLTGCIANALIGTPEEPDGVWVTNFRPAQHDCGEKILFAGSSFQTLIPDTCATPQQGVQDVFTALDVLAVHLDTARFISTKLLQKFVTDEPSETMIDAVVAVWDDPSMPAGRGDLREVLRAVLAQADVLDPLAMRDKIKTPFEHVASGLRAVRGKTNGLAGARNYIRRMQYKLHENPIPTGYPERGDAWIETNNVLERMNFGLDLTGRSGVNFGSDIITLLQDHGISTANENAEAIVDFFADILFGGAIGSAARQVAIDYLNTDDSGVPANYDNLRIRETVGFMLGFPEFMEQ